MRRANNSSHFAGCRPDDTDIIRRQDESHKRKQHLPTQSSRKVLSFGTIRIRIAEDNCEEEIVGRKDAMS